MTLGVDSETMLQKPRIGLDHEHTFVVGPEHLIPFADDQMPAVLATPHLIHEMEKCCPYALEPILEPHERSVGIALDVTHRAPSLEGFTVTCRGRVIGHDGSEIVFAVEAHDGTDLLSRGVHRRAVVDVRRLQRRVARKRGDASS